MTLLIWGLGLIIVLLVAIYWKLCQLVTLIAKLSGAAMALSAMTREERETTINNPELWQVL